MRLTRAGPVLVVGTSGTGGEEARIAPIRDTELLPVGTGLTTLQWREVF